MSGLKRIAIERDRQVTEEGHTAAHDDGHHEGELVQAALCYIDPKVYEWPWSRGYEDVPGSGETSIDFAGRLASSADAHISHRIDNLVRAGALIAAEIDRLERRVPTE